MLLTADGKAKVGDVGLARFMAADYMSAQAALGTFSWTVQSSSIVVLQESVQPFSTLLRLDPHELLLQATFSPHHSCSIGSDNSVVYCCRRLRC